MKSVWFRDFILGAVALCLACAIVCCGPGGSVGAGDSVIGTYSDSSGSFVLDVRAGGVATYTSAGARFPCTYTIAGDKLTLTCQGQSAKTVFTIHGNSSLTAENSVAGTLKKTK